MGSSKSSDIQLIVHSKAEYFENKEPIELSKCSLNITEVKFCIFDVSVATITFYKFKTCSRLIRRSFRIKNDKNNIGSIRHHQLLF